MTTLVQLLVLSAALVAAIATQRCSNIRRCSEQKPLVVSLADLHSRAIVWFRPSDPATDDIWTASFHLGKNETDGSFTRKYELQLKKPKGKNFLGCKFFQAGSRKSFLDERFSRSWLAAGMWVGLGLSESHLSLTFQTLEMQLQLQLTTKEEFAGFEDVKLVGDMEVTVDCSGPEGDTTTTTSTTSTSTSTSTTTASTTTTTEEPSTTEAYDSSTSTQDTITGAVDVGDTTASSPDVESEKQTEADDKDCEQTIPWWVWVCVGLTGAFFIFFLILLSYTIVLHRRNWKLTDTVTRQGQYLRGRTATPGGYGVEARDVQYYEMRNHNIMVGGTTPRLVTPSPRPKGRCNTAPRLSPYGRSTSYPGTPKPCPTLQFPSPPSKEASPSSFLDEHYLPPPPDDLEEYMYGEMDALHGRKSYNFSENGLADDERSLGTLDNRVRVRN